MTKKVLIFNTLLLSMALFLGSCSKQNKQPKPLNVPILHVVADTTARLSDQMQCHVHVDFAYLKGKQYKAANDSLLKMGLLQPDYFAINSVMPSPQEAVRMFAKKYATDYLEMAKQLRIKEKQAAKTIGELNIKTSLKAGEGDNLIAIANILVNSGNGEETQYRIIRNFNPNTGRVITLKDKFGNDYKETVNKKIEESFTRLYDLDEDDFNGVRQKGLFQGIDVYPADNFEITDDSIFFIYNPGEISTHAVRIGIEN